MRSGSIIDDSENILRKFQAPRTRNNEVTAMFHVPSSKVSMNEQMVHSFRRDLQLHQYQICPDPKVIDCLKISVL